MKCTRRQFLRSAAAAGLAGLTGAAGLLGQTACGGSNSVDTPETDPDKLLANYAGYVNLVGDIHVHSNLSDGDESPDFALEYARDVSKLDFSAITDHAEVIVSDGRVALPYYRTIPAKYDEPGKFSVLFGYEWTSIVFGHRSVYSLDNNLPLLSSKDPAFTDIEDFWKGLSGHDAIAVPHHVMMPSTYTWWHYSNPPLERLVEFYSKWGLSLRHATPRPVHDPRPEHSIFTAFNAGKQYGFIANSDTHCSRPGSHLYETRPGSLLYPQPGTVGVWASAHTREAIYEALKQRRCYGMTGTRVNLQVSVNKSVMGSDIESASAPAIAFRISSPVKIKSAAIMKVAHGMTITIQDYAPESLAFSSSFIDHQYVENAGYFVIVELDNTDMVLSSPVWVTKTA